MTAQGELDPAIIVVIDSDPFRRTAIYHVCSELAYTIPVATLAELGAVPNGAWLVVNDEGGALAEVNEALLDLQGYHPVLAYNETIDLARVTAAFHSGAVGYIPWPCQAEQLRETARTLQTTAHWWGRVRANEMGARAKLAKLSTREREVVAALHSGLSNKATAHLLGISIRTVEVHRLRAIAKLGVPNSVVAGAVWADAHYPPLSLAA